MKRNQTKLHMTGYKGKRGLYRDKGREFLAGRKCCVCEKALERKVSIAGRLEQWDRFLARKSCGRNPDNTLTDCEKTMRAGEGNPKWRGGKPKCVWCGKEMAWYASKNYKSMNKFCLSCWKELQHTPKRYLYPRIDKIIEMNEKLSKV